MATKIYNFIFTALLLILGIIALTNFHSYMDQYEVGILIASVLGFSFFGIKWQRFKHFFITSFVLAFIAIFLYQGNLNQVESNFFLKYFA